jgi:hypothetical protein
MDLREYAHHIESELDMVGQDHEDDCKLEKADILWWYYHIYFGHTASDI